MIVLPIDDSMKWPKCNLHDWASLRSELLFVYDQVIPAESANIKGMREGDFSAWLVRKGGAWIKTDGVEARAGEGEWLICFGREIEQSLLPDTHLFSLRILQGWPDGSSLFSKGPLHVLEAAKYPKLEKLALPLLRLVGRVSWDAGTVDPREIFLWRNQLDYLMYNRYQSHLVAWLSELAKSLVREGKKMHVPGTIDPRVASALQAVDASSPGDPFPERDVCRVGGLSIGRLNRLCVQAYGFTVHAYWEKRRIQRARQALEIPATRIKKVASELGFVQLSHFSAWFKRQAGLSPRAYRQGLRSG